MRTLVRLIALQLIRTRAGRWILSIALLAVAAFCFLAASGPVPQSELMDLLVTGAVILVLGLAALFWTIRIDLAWRQAKATRHRVAARVEELKASGELLPIPPLPPPPKGVAEATLAGVAEYAERMARLPWGEPARVTEADVRRTFESAVARTRRIRGDWSQLSEPIDTFVGLTKPLCYVGAAEVMYRLSYLQFRTFAPVGLRQGLRFIARAQYHDTRQPDALVIRTKLLAGGRTKQWLDLADQTLAVLKQVAPDHPRLPDAEAIIHTQRGEYEEALACLEHAIANAPSPEEAYVAYGNRAQILDSLGRHEEALAAYDQVLALDPRDPWVWHNKSIVLCELRRYDDALEANGRALAIMDFSNARKRREWILKKLAEAGGA